jgi:nicotinate-nucleotide--dimethylbenzimidazole phosphoribosyltransferase
MVTFDITQPLQDIRMAAQQKIDNLNKPKGSLGMLEDIALQLCLIQHTLDPCLTHPCHLLLGADHGIEREGVSVSPREVTWQQMINFTHGGGFIDVMCRQHHFDLKIVDMGVDHDLTSYPDIIDNKVAKGTADFRYGPAMTNSQWEECIKKGASLVDSCYQKGCNIISIGEMGIGNTSPSSLWMHLLTNIPLKECIGAGSGLNSEGLQHKYNILQESLDHFLSNHPDISEKLEKSNNNPPYYTKQQVINILTYFGGFEMVAAVGAMLRAAELHIIIIIDGFIMSACILGASMLYPHILDFAIFGHCGDESGHKIMLHCMHASAILNLNLRLGEGTGALCAFPIIDSACRMINEMNNFQNAHITKYF